MAPSVRLPKSLYSRTMLLVGMIVFLLQIFTFTIIFKQMVLPNVYTQVDQFVDELELLSQQPERLQHLEEESQNSNTAGLHQFVYGVDDQKLEQARWHIPFWYLVETELQHRFGHPIPFYQEADALPGEEYFWINLPLSDSSASARVGFSANREGCLNPSVLLLVLFFAISFTVISIYFLSRWLVRPIEELQMAVGEMGRGEYPEPLPEKGPSEFLSLVKRFNWMVKNVQSLTENRATLLAGISHDLKTPLARMRLSVEMLSSEKDRDLLEGIVEDLDVMDGMIREVLTYARGEKQGREQEIEINGLISSIVERKRRGGMEIEWQERADPCLCRIDISALQRILSNYLDNARRYGGEPSTEVTLVCSPDSVVEVCVIDYGPGLVEKELEAVFQPFYRVDPSRSAQGGGSGLGLAIVKNLATINGWEVSLHNHKGGGVEAKVSLYSKASS